MQSFGACKIWSVQNLDDYAKFVLRKIWIEQDLDHAEFGSCAVRNLRKTNHN